MPLRIGIVAGTHGAQTGGGWTYTSALTAELARARSVHTFVFIDPLLQPQAQEATRVKPVRVEAPAPVDAGRASPRAWAANAIDALDSVGLRPIRRPGAGASARPAADFPAFLDRTFSQRIERVILREQLDLIWYLIPDGSPVSVPYVATVLDLEHRKQPWFPEVSYTDWTWTDREANFSRLLPRASFVITGTEQGKREIVHFYGVNGPNVAVLPFFAPPVETPIATEVVAVRAKHGIRGEYLLYPAQFWPHKNHVNLLTALEHLGRTQGLRPTLVLTGSEKGNREHVHQTSRALGLTDRVLDLGFVSAEDLKVLYGGAAALVYPSFFGPDNLPPLEAYAHGCPVIASDIPGSREQLGDAALFFDPMSPADMASRIAEVLTDADLRNRMIEAGRALALQRPVAGYVETMSALIDRFEARRRSWSTRYEREPAPAPPRLTAIGISFARGEAGTTALIEGWGEPEDWGTWSTELHCLLRLNLGKQPDTPLTAALRYRLFQSGELDLACYVDVGPAQAWRFERTKRSFTALQPRAPLRIRIDPDAVLPNGDIDLTFLFPVLVSPAKLGVSSDERLLGIGIEGISIEAA